MPKSSDLKIANLSCLSEKDKFLFQASSMSREINKFIEEEVPNKEKSWLPDLNSWRLKIRWLLKLSELCLDNYDQVFFDCGDELLDLNDSENYQSFREKIIEELI